MLRTRCDFAWQPSRVRRRRVAHDEQRSVEGLRGFRRLTPTGCHDEKGDDGSEPEWNTHEEADDLQACHAGSVPVTAVINAFSLDGRDARSCKVTARPSSSVVGTRQLGYS
jgi:hypothetical protein